MRLHLTGIEIQNAKAESDHLEKQQRPMKPADLEAAQDWYWTEEFPRASGLEPGTGNMTTWFHGIFIFNYLLFNYLIFINALS